MVYRTQTRRKNPNVSKDIRMVYRALGRRKKSLLYLVRVSEKKIKNERVTKR